MKELGAEIQVQNVLELITRLKQICNADPETGESSKIEDIRQRVETLVQQQNRSIIFSQYTSENFGVDAVAQALCEFNPLCFKGNLSQDQRRSVIQRFRSIDAHKVLILSLRSGGVGLNRQEASYVFHLDRWWNPPVERQAEDRSHRYGQTIPVNVFKYSCVGTIEERIDQILEQKQDLFDRLVDDVSIDLSTSPTSDQLFGLFGLEMPERANRDRRQRPSGLELEARCAQILQKRGWTVERTHRSRDGGIDVIGFRTDEVGVEQRVYVQCKDHGRPIGVQVVRELLGAVPADQNASAVLAAPVGLTTDAKGLANKRGVIIWDERKLEELEAEN